jgi:hypothetical protein
MATRPPADVELRIRPHPRCDGRRIVQITYDPEHPEQTRQVRSMLTTVFGPPPATPEADSAAGGARR